jgi:hypothetical protein
VRGRLGYSGGVVAEAGASVNGEATGREAVGGERAGDGMGWTMVLTGWPRQRTLGELYIGNNLFAEYFLLGTRQRICRVPFDTRQRKVTVTAQSDGDGFFAECLLWHSAKRPILPSVCYYGRRQRRLQWAHRQSQCRELS